MLGRSVLSGMMMLWMLMIGGFLGYRQITQENAPPKPQPQNERVWLR